MREFAYHEDKNYRFRPTMEDTHALVDKLGGDPSCGLFAIFDGHGGRQVADYCAERVVQLMKQEIPRERGDLSALIERIYARVDGEVGMIDDDNCGSTACIVIIRVEQGQRVVYVSNVGDTRAVIQTFKGAERLSVDHKASDQAEIDRIRGGGGILFDNRVGGSLAITRAFGDRSLKKNGVISKPFIRKKTIGSGEKSMVIACDGVWDVLDAHEAMDLCKDPLGAKDIAKQIVK